jgi:hypothetical protein
MKRIITLDPGTLNTGWAVMTQTEVIPTAAPDASGAIGPKQGVTTVEASGTWVRPKKVPPEGAHAWMWQQLTALVAEWAEKKLAPSELWLEMYYPFGNANIRPRKNTHQQVLLVGGYLGLAYVFGLRVVSVSPKEWKDWVKYQTAGAGALGETQHESDAIWIGHYAFAQEGS